MSFLTFNGISNTAYKNWLQEVQPTAAKHEFASFVGKKVAAHADGVWTPGTVQCLHQGILPSMTRTLPANTLLPNKSQPFSIVWADNTDSICDLPSVLTFLDNVTSNRYRTNATSSPATGRSARMALMVRQPLPPSHPHPLSHSPLSPPAMLPRLHLLVLQEFLRASPLNQGISSIALQAQVLWFSTNCSTRSVFLSSATFA
jgi:hypothetical protein